MPDNNGNLLKHEIHIPNQTMRWQQYEYDSLNRLQSAREVLNGGAEQWKQQFTYAGNLTNGTYSGAGNRIYDAENKMTSAKGNNKQDRSTVTMVPISGSNVRQMGLRRGARFDYSEAIRVGNFFEGCRAGCPTTRLTTLRTKT